MRFNPPRFWRNLCLCLLFSISACGKEEQEISATGTFFDLLETPVGNVEFPTGCNADAAPLVERGVALLHHMMYDGAGFVFGMAEDADPDCAMAYWGQAMTLIHPLWPDIPSQQSLERGLSLVEKSLSLGGHSDRENAYLDTTRAYFEDGVALTEGERLVRFEAAWKSLSEAYPNDLEARAFYSLALRAIAGAGDKTRSIPRKAGRIAESVLAENPTHPGGHHYVIHAYDYPELAEKALETADNYGIITPRIPHATHMMTHIYTLLGLWDKAIEWNTTSAEAAWALCLQTGEINLHYTHALDYLVYAHLQMNNDSAALELLQTAAELQPPYSETNRDASAYAFSALPARYALERRDWTAATKLEPRMPSSFPWEAAHDPYVAITHFARAIGFARLGRPDQARLDLEALESLGATTASIDPYWVQQVKIQEQTARAWLTYSSGNVEFALQQMKIAAENELSTDKHGITPGEVLPATELYGDMLLETEHFEEALTAYRTALGRSPRRYNGLYGAAKAALGVGDEEAAREYFAELISISGDANKPRQPTREAQKFLQSQ